MGTNITDLKKIYREQIANEFKEDIIINLEREASLRYGENPNQPAALYRIKDNSLAELTNIRVAKTGKGGLSATNYMDVTRAIDILKFFSNKPAIAVMKHTIPSGFSTISNNSHSNNSLEKIYIKARDCDARAAFGSVVISNKPIDKVTAEAIISSYVEAVAAPEYEPGVMGLFDTKKDLRTILYSNIEELPKYGGDNVENTYDIKALPSGRIILQKPYLTSIRNQNNLIIDAMLNSEKGKCVVERRPSETETKDMLTSWYINIGVRSNGIVFVKDGTTIAVGTGQQERVGAVEQAITKAYQKALELKGEKPAGMSWKEMKERLGYSPLEGAVMSSDAFFPFRDSIDTAAEHGVTAIIQPGGSLRDYEIIQAVNEHKLAMALTLERCFGHF